MPKDAFSVKLRKVQITSPNLLPQRQLGEEGLLKLRQVLLRPREFPAQAKHFHLIILPARTSANLYLLPHKPKVLPLNPSLLRSVVVDLPPQSNGSLARSFRLISSPSNAASPLQYHSLLYRHVRIQRQVNGLRRETAGMRMSLLILIIHLRGKDVYLGLDWG